MVENMIVSMMIKKRDKELETKNSPKVSQVSVEKQPTDKPKKECPPGKILNPKTGRCINKPKEKTQKRREDQRNLINQKDGANQPINLKDRVNQPINLKDRVN